MIEFRIIKLEGFDEFKIQRRPVVNSHGDRGPWHDHLDYLPYSLGHAGIVYPTMESATVKLKELQPGALEDIRRLAAQWVPVEEA